MQGRLFVDSLKSANSGPSEQSHQNQTKPKKKQTKQKTTHNHNQTKPNRTQRSGIATSNGNNMHDDILSVIMRMATEKEAKQRKHRNTKRGQVRG